MTGSNASDPDVGSGLCSELQLNGWDCSKADIGAGLVHKAVKRNVRILWNFVKD